LTASLNFARGLLNLFGIGVAGFLSGMALTTSATTALMVHPFVVMFKSAVAMSAQPDMLVEMFSLVEREYVENETLNAAADTSNTHAVQDIAQNNSPALIKKIGKMTYIVRVHFGTTSKETFEDKVKRMLREEVRQMTENE